jgi:hypothetical protein
MNCECGGPLSDFPDAFTRGLCAACYTNARTFPDREKFCDPGEFRAQRSLVRMSEIGRPVWFFGRSYLWVDGGAGLCLVRMPGWWK